MTQPRVKPFTGRHVTLILVAFFGVVIAVNFTMAYFAASTFGGVVVQNSYVASQEYNDWLDKAEDQAALGWTVERNWREDRHLVVRLGGVPKGATVDAIARHPLGRLPDQKLIFTPGDTDSGDNQSFVSTEALPAGRWILRTRVNAGDKQWRSEEYIE